jgi:hypothetical protein
MARIRRRPVTADVRLLYDWKLLRSSSSCG